MGKRLNWGVAGVGMIAHDFLTAMASLSPEQHKVTAVAGKDLDRVYRLATLHNISTAYEGYDAIAADSTIDIVFVSVLNLQHYDRGKKNCFSSKGCGRGFSLHTTLWTSTSLAAVLGDIYHINVQFGVEINDIERNLMKDLGGGVVLDLGIYMLQLLQFIYKEPPTDIMCTGHLSKTGVDESMSCALKYKDGRTATIAAHTRTSLANRAEINGTKGTIHLDYFWCPTVLHISAANSTEWTLPKGKYKFHFHNSAGLAYQIQECWDCINNGLLESPKMSLDESILLSKLCDTMRTQLGVLDS
ncbi:unnamed protein product [Danaus chrysippus]|uniref:Trans-1,2-dihydrobenzene-1,2-diol dehydrogenase n=1 Tax=Danaus chrysippus TaxID=151541 RepID=A0A8J2R627_9NEOP|nr:unnamed protein product [Danaus chrysippus]